MQRLRGESGALPSPWPVTDKTAPVSLIISSAIFTLPECPLHWQVRDVLHALRAARPEVLAALPGCHDLRPAVLCGAFTGRAIDTRDNLAIVSERNWRVTGPGVTDECQGCILRGFPWRYTLLQIESFLLSACRLPSSFFSDCNCIAGHKNRRGAQAATSVQYNYGRLLTFTWNS